MRWLIVLAACGGPAAPAPVVTNVRVAPPAGLAKIVTCGSFSSNVHCFATRAACDAKLENCLDVARPHWMCARWTSEMLHSTVDQCLPREDFCAGTPSVSDVTHDPCRPVPAVYCHGASELSCRPTQAICEQEVKTNVSFGGEPSPCVRYD